MIIKSAYDKQFKNWDYTTDLRSLSEVYGKFHTAPSKLIKLYTQNPFQTFMEEMGAVYKTGGKGEGIKGFKYSWDVQGVPNYTTTISVDTTLDPDLGRNFQEFNICLAENIANINDVLYTQNEQHLFVVAQPIKSSEGKYIYTVKIHNNDSDAVMDANYLRTGNVVSVLTNLQPEYSRVGFMSERRNKESRVNYISKHRVGREFTGEAAMANNHIVCDYVDGKMRPLMWMTGLEKDMMEELMFHREKNLIFGVSNINPENDRLVGQGSTGQSEDIWSGDGVYEAIKREGINEVYSVFTEGLFRDMLSSIIQRSPLKATEGMKILLMTGYKGLVQFDTAMRDILKGIPGDNNWIYSKDGNKIKVGAGFKSYEYLGCTFTVVRNPMFDDRNLIADELDVDGFPMRSSMFLALDVSNYNGAPNIQVLTRDGVSVITNYTLGMGGKDGKTSGSFSSRVHGSSMDMITYGGVAVHVPETCMILRKSRLA